MGAGLYGRGRECENCDTTQRLVDRYCRYCGARLRELRDFEEPAPVPDNDEPESVALAVESVEETMTLLEEAQKHGAQAHRHDTIRPSTALMARKLQQAYEELVYAHPSYELDIPDE